MMIAKYVLPEHWLPAIVNDDYAELNESEQEQLLRFMRHSVECHGHFRCLGATKETGEGIQWRHDATPYGVLACECWEVAFDVEHDGESQ